MFQKVNNYMHRYQTICILKYSFEPIINNWPNYTKRSYTESSHVEFQSTSSLASKLAFDLWMPAENSSSAEICHTSTHFHLFFLHAQPPPHSKLIYLMSQFSFRNISSSPRNFICVFDTMTCILGAHLYLATIHHFNMSLTYLDWVLDILQCLNLISCQLSHLPVA